MAIPYLACMLAVASQLHLPPRVLPSIQTVEAGQVGMVHTNINGTEDLGLMQVNSVWIPALSQRTGLSSEIVRDKLVQDACFNITVAGAVLRYYLRETQGNLLAAIGNYHSHTPVRNLRYQLKVIEAATALFGAGSGRCGSPAPGAADWPDGDDASPRDSSCSRRTPQRKHREEPGPEPSNWIAWPASSASAGRLA